VQEVAEGGRGATGFALAKGRFDSVEPADLVRAAGTLPVEFRGTRVADVEQPRSLARFVAIGALPDLTDPYSRRGPVPTDAHGSGNLERVPGARAGRVFKDATVVAESVLCRPKTPAVVPRPVVLPAITLEIHRG